MSQIISTHEEYLILRKRFYASTGVRLYNAFLANKLAHYTFETNYHDLNDLIRSHFELRMSGQLGDWNNKEPLHEFLGEVTRLLHNYLSSAKTLVDNTRFFVKNTFGEDSSAYLEYDSAVKKRFANSLVSKFTLDLRRNITHVCMPFISSVMGGSKARGRDLFTLKLLISKTNPSWDWSSGAKSYIAAQNGEIDLELYAIEYREQILGFYDWLAAKIPSWGDAEWNEMLSLQDRLIQYETRTDSEPQVKIPMP